MTLETPAHLILLQLGKLPFPSEDTEAKELAQGHTRRPGVHSRCLALETTECGFPSPTFCETFQTCRKVERVVHGHPATYSLSLHKCYVAMEGVNGHR